MVVAAFRSKALLTACVLLLAVEGAWADKYQATIEVFRQAGESASFFENSYGYAVFPTVGKAGLGVGGAVGEGLVYLSGDAGLVGKTTVTQLSIGWQLGGQAYSMIVFLQDRRAFEEFTSGNFEFSAQAEAVAITAGVSAAARTSGSSVTASGTEYDAATAGRYYKGMAVFTVTKGGLMYEASIGGQKFSYKPL
jgi:lipid-binding SYLF domain-containing protein